MMDRWSARAAALVGCLLAVGASAGRPSDDGAARRLASEARESALARPRVAHGALHDPSVDAALARWHALGRPAGRAKPAALQSAPADRTITIRTQGSNLDFEPREISAKAGTRLRLVYVNEGVLPHNFVLLHEEDDVDVVGPASAQSPDTGFVAVKEHGDKMIAYTALASPGQTVDVTFVVPPPGEYLFVCTVPGHYNVMIGTLRSVP
jgi:uncharacterized cupredoxin-like copper-binding protein